MARVERFSRSTPLAKSSISGTCASVCPFCRQKLEWVFYYHVNNSSLGRFTHTISCLFEIKLQVNSQHSESFRKCRNPRSSIAMGSCFSIRS